MGSGSGQHAQLFREVGHEVTECDLSAGRDYVREPFTPHDVVWASHVLEHMPDVNWALRKMRSECEGWLAVTVPPAKHAIVGGHVSLWNAGLLLYNLILAGWNCREAMVLSEGYDISVIVRREDAQLPKLAMDSGDIERLAEFFPLPVRQGFDGRIARCNWSR